MSSKIIIRSVPARNFAFSILLAFVLALMILLPFTARAALTCADLFSTYSWSQQVSDWVNREHFSASDIAIVDRLVRSKKLSERDGYMLVEGTFESDRESALQTLVSRRAISKAEAKRLEDAFDPAVIGREIGTPEMMSMVVKGLPEPRRAQVRVQEASFGALADGNIDLVIFDPATNRPLAKLSYELNGYKHAVISEVFVMKHERTQGYTTALLRELLRRYPRLKVVSFRLSKWDIAELIAQTNSKNPQDWVENGYIFRAATAAGVFGFEIGKPGEYEKMRVEAKAGVNPDYYRTRRPLR